MYFPPYFGPAGDAPPSSWPISLQDARHEGTRDTAKRGQDSGAESVWEWRETRPKVGVLFIFRHLPRNREVAKVFTRIKGGRCEADEIVLPGAYFRCTQISDIPLYSSSVVGY